MDESLGCADRASRYSSGLLGEPLSAPSGLKTWIGKAWAFLISNYSWAKGLEIRDRYLVLQTERVTLYVEIGDIKTSHTNAPVADDTVALLAHAFEKDSEGHYNDYWIHM